MRTAFIFSLISARSAAPRLISVLVMLATVLLAAEAGAAVPMCSEDGRTIAAPPTGTAVRGLVLEAPPPCPNKASPLATRSLPAEPGAPIATPAPSPLRALPVWFAGVPRASSVRLPVGADAPALPTGFLRTIERPPRA